MVTLLIDEGCLSQHCFETSIRKHAASGDSGDTSKFCGLRREESISAFAIVRPRSLVTLSHPIHFDLENEDLCWNTDHQSQNQHHHLLMRLMIQHALLELEE